MNTIYNTTQVLAVYERALMVRIGTRLGMVQVMCGLPDQNGLAEILPQDQNYVELNRLNNGRQLDQENMIGAFARISESSFT